MSVRADTELQYPSINHGSTGTVHDLNLNGLAQARFSGGGVATLTGVQPQFSGRLMAFTRAAGSSVASSGEDGGSSAANRFATTATLAAAARKARMSWYDPLSARWRVQQ